MLVQAMNSLTACFKGLSPSDDDLFDSLEGDDEAKTAAISVARADPSMVALRQRTEGAISGVVQVWNGDAEVADAISSLLKQATLSTSETLVSLSALPLLSLVCAACEQSPSALWMSLASTLTLRIGTATSPLQLKKDKTEEEEAQKLEEDKGRWNVVADAGNRLGVIAGRILGPEGGMRDNPDVVEAWFKFSSAVSLHVRTLADIRSRRAFLAYFSACQSRSLRDTCPSGSWVSVHKSDSRSRQRPSSSCVSVGLGLTTDCPAC